MRIDPLNDVGAGGTIISGENKAFLSLRPAAAWLALLMLAGTLLLGRTSDAQPGPQEREPRIRTIAGAPSRQPEFRAENYLFTNKWRAAYESDPGFQGVSAAAAKFWSPHGLSVTESGDLLIADSHRADYVDRTRAHDRHSRDFEIGSHCDPCPSRSSGRLDGRARRIRNGSPLLSSLSGGFAPDPESPSTPRKFIPTDYDVEVFKDESGKDELYVVGFYGIWKVTAGDNGEVDEVLDSPDPNDSGDGRFNKDKSEKVVRVAGEGTGCFQNAEGLPATESCIYAAHDVEFDKEGHMFIASQFTNAIRRVDRGTGTIDGCVVSSVGAGGEQIFDHCGPDDPQEIMTTVAGGRVRGGYSGEPVPAKAGTLYRPSGIAFDRKGNLLIADTFNHRVRKVSAGVDGLVTGAPDEILTTVAGTGSGSGPGYGVDDTGPAANPSAGQRGWENDIPPIPALTAHLDTPRHLEVDRANNLFVADAENDRIRKIAPGPDGDLGTPDDTITTVAGGNVVNGQPSGRDNNVGVDPGDNTYCHAPDCPALDVKLEHPFGLTIAPCRDDDLHSDIYVSDWMHRKVRAISGVARCAPIDLAVQDIGDSPESVLAGRDVKYTAGLGNAGPGEATGVKVTATLPAGAVFKSSSMPGCSPGAGLQVVCPIGQMPAGASSSVDFTVTLTLAGTNVFGMTISASEPREAEKLLGDNSQTEETQVTLPELPPLPQPQSTSPPAPEPAAGEADSGTPPPLSSSLPQAASIETQLGATVSPPAGPGPPGPATANVPVLSAQPLPGKVPLTGSLGFQAGAASQSAETPSAATQAAAAAPDEDPQPAPRYSMVRTAEQDLEQGWKTASASILLMTAMFCAGGSRFRTNSASTLRSAAPGWGSSAGGGPRNAGRPAL